MHDMQAAETLEMTSKKSTEGCEWKHKHLSRQRRGDHRQDNSKEHVVSSKTNKSEKVD